MKLQTIPQNVEDFDPAPEDESGSRSAARLPTPDEVFAVTKDAAEGIAAHFPWAGALVEAALLCPAEQRRPVTINTEWGGETVKPERADEAKHLAYSEHILRVIHYVYPWLLPLLDSSKASLLVSPGMCCFTVHSRLGYVFDIPELIPLTHLTPFAAEKGDAIH